MGGEAGLTQGVDPHGCGSVHSTSLRGLSVSPQALREDRLWT